jgi:adenylate cyclase
MYTDMVGYTALGQRNESFSLALVKEQRKMIKPILLRHNGDEIKTMGDAFLIQFSSALDAVRCAYDIQRALREFNISLPEDRRVRLRIGIHLGDVVESQGDILGDAVNVASRIGPLAEDGGVCLTRQVYDHIQNKFELRLVSLGAKPLKNVGAPVEVYKMVMPWSEEVRIGAETELDKNRVAILPLRNMSPDPSDDYFAEGMTEELITVLSKIGQLTVIGRTSVMQYKNTTKRIHDISRELSAGTLIEGSVRKADNRVRISVQLLDSKTEGHIWAENYDRDLDDVFEIQSDVARRVSDALKVRILPPESRSLEARPTANTGAHILYLKGRYHWNERTPASVKTAVDYFQKAIDVDSSFSLPYAGLADSYAVLADQAVMRPLEAATYARNFAKKALELDTTLAEAHATLGWVLSAHFWEWDAAELEFRRSIELNPNYPSARQWYGKYHSFRGNFLRAMEEHRKALELDPFSLIININLAEALVEAGRYSEGIEQAKRALAINPDFAIGHYELGQFYVSGSEFEKAVAEFKRVLEIAPGLVPALASLGHVYGLMGRREEAVRILVDLKEKSSSTYVFPAAFAMIKFGLGNKEEAFKHIDEAYDERSNWLNYFKAFPGFEDIRADERFARVVQRMGL